MEVKLLILAAVGEITKLYVASLEQKHTYIQTCKHYQFYLKSVVEPNTPLLVHG